MAHYNTVFAQFLKFVPRHEFDRLADEHHEGCRLRAMTRWSQFVALATGQLSGRLRLPRGSIVVKDRGHTDFAWYQELMENGIFFVTRARKNACYDVLDERPAEGPYG